MASHLRDSSKPQLPENDPLLDCMEFIPTQVSPVQWEEGISNLPIPQLNFPPNDSVSCAKKELSALWEMFNSWLQPEKHSKEQMISQLVLKEFLITGKCKDKFAFKEKWESSDRNMGRFMEGLIDECLKPPVMVHIAMQGQEALFSETMSLKEAINLLKEQQSSRSSTQETARTPFPVSQDMLLKTGEYNEDGQNNTWNTRDVNGGNSSPGNQIDSLIIIQKEQFPEPEHGRNVYSKKSKAFETTEISNNSSTRECKDTLADPTRYILGDSSAGKLDGRGRRQYPEPEDVDFSFGTPQDVRRAIQGTSSYKKSSYGSLYTRTMRKFPHVQVKAPQKPQTLQI
ncbi:zinc finger and SCAN domain containing protein 4C-like [Peromyscus californicus insignis]|uniref:zinc finger and SCAN domain containing protein 4C-like n=1 Tax=Peromyscus californicus insignis TaxID=564181 RepID=UPI0022A782B0|nr:zinc finger and SCAN domain containing protein 4C-like [Peromyscus californicus insignis]